MQHNRRPGRDDRGASRLAGAPGGFRPPSPSPTTGGSSRARSSAGALLGEPISRVRQFLEKPSPLTAHACLQMGWLWNTFVFVAKASLLVDVGSRFPSRGSRALCRTSAPSRTLPRPRTRFAGPTGPSRRWASPARCWSSVPRASWSPDCPWCPWSDLGHARARGQEPSKSQPPAALVRTSPTSWGSRTTARPRGAGKAR
jgi:hypothetical protein